VNRSEYAHLERIRKTCQSRIADSTARIDQSVRLVSDSTALLNIASVLTREDATDHVPTVER
jgi:hypothetical protein